MPHGQRSKCKTRNYIKLLEEIISKTLSDINHSRILYDPPPRVMEIKSKINKWDLIKLKSFCTMEDILLKAIDGFRGQKKNIQSVNTKKSSRITYLTALFSLLVVKLLVLNNVYLLVWQLKQRILRL